MEDWVKVPASAGKDAAGEQITVLVLVDTVDYIRLGDRKLSIGSHGYAQMWDPPQGVMLLHRWIMAMPAGTGYSVIVDHINKDVLDCRRNNLRCVSPAESNMNRTIVERELPLGVYRVRSGRYTVRLARNRVDAIFGTYDTIEEASAVAAAAYQNPDLIAVRGAIKRPLKLSTDQVAEIRRKYAAGGITQLALANEYNVSLAYVNGIIKGRARNVPL